MKSIITASIACALGLIISGCSVGMAPSGMSRDEARDALGKLSPQDQIRYYRSSPMPKEDKQKHFAEIEAKYGVKESDVPGSVGPPSPAQTGQ